MPLRLPWYREDRTDLMEGRQPAPKPVEQVPERTGYVAGIPPGGLDEDQVAIGTSTQTDRKSLMIQLWEAYLACPWAWACVNAVARTITAGGLVTDWDADDGDGDQDEPEKPPEVLALERFISFCNPSQDIRQVMRNAIADLEVFGDAYLEITWWGNLPVAIYNLDSPTTTPVADVHGLVTGYVQVTDYGQKAKFEPREVIHISMDSARPGVLGVSSTQAALLPITGWLFAAATGKEMFRKGLPPAIHADFPQQTQEGTSKIWADKYQTQNIGPKNIGRPIVTKGGATLSELQAGKVGDVLQYKDQCRDEIVSSYGVPPAEAGIIESGNIGGGTGDSQHRSYMINKCGPIAEILLEKLNFHIVTQAFGVKAWRLKFAEVDYRDSTIVEGIRDTRLRNGSWTLNKYRTEIGEQPVDGGDDAVLVDRQNLVLWADIKAFSAAGVASKGTQPPVLGVPPPPGEPDPDDPGAQPGGEDEKDPAESLPEYAAQRASFRRRFREALRKLPPVTEDEGAA